MELVEVGETYLRHLAKSTQQRSHRLLMRKRKTATVQQLIV